MGYKMMSYDELMASDGRVGATSRDLPDPSDWVDWIKCHVNISIGVQTATSILICFQLHRCLDFL